MDLDHLKKKLAAAEVGKTEAVEAVIRAADETIRNQFATTIKNTIIFFQYA